MPERQQKMYLRTDNEMAFHFVSSDSEDIVNNKTYAFVVKDKYHLMNLLGGIKMMQGKRL